MTNCIKINDIAPPYRPITNDIQRDEFASNIHLMTYYKSKVLSGLVHAIQPASSMPRYVIGVVVHSILKYTELEKNVIITTLIMKQGEIHSTYT